MALATLEDFLIEQLGPTGRRTATGVTEAATTESQVRRLEQVFNLSGAPSDLGLQTEIAESGGQ